ncbi:ComF family protein [Kitasatospora arboriphila]
MHVVRAPRAPGGARDAAVHRRPPRHRSARPAAAHPVRGLRRRRGPALSGLPGGTDLHRRRAGGALPGPKGLPPLYAAAPYAGPVRHLLIAHKERGALRLARPLGAALAAAVRSAAEAGAPGAPGALLLVPVPSARRAVRARGHDPMLRLARAAARELSRSGRPALAAAALRHVRPVADQAGLSAAERHRNLHGALAVPPRRAALLSGRRLVLVDDLVTTGASLAEAARALRAAAARRAPRPRWRRRPAGYPGGVSPGSRTRRPGAPAARSRATGCPAAGRSGGRWSTR